MAKQWKELTRKIESAAHEAEHSGDHGTAAQLYKAALYVLLGLVPAAGENDALEQDDTLQCGSGGAAGAATRSGDEPKRPARNSAAVSRVRIKR